MLTLVQSEFFKHASHDLESARIDLTTQTTADLTMEEKVAKIAAEIATELTPQALPISQIDESARDEKLHFLLKTHFGYSNFRLEQLGIIRSVLDGRDTLAIMPTGGGKSLCYQIPALYLDGITLVVSPLISLMQDQVLNLSEYGIPAVYLNSTLSGSEKFKTRTRILAGEVKLVYVSPEGLLSPELSEFFGAVKVSLIAIDEAHCVSQWGHEFRKDYTRLHELKSRFPKTPMVALTATADPKTQVDIASQLAMKNTNVFVSSFDRPNIRYLIRERDDELKQLLKFIETSHPTDTGIVYCLSRAKVERVAEVLAKKGMPAIAYHAGLPIEQRTANQKRFSADERVIVVATIAFGMGIDRPDVRFVAHLDLPKSIESYYQETGRAGRDGKPSTAWMVYGLQDVVKLSQMLETTEADESYKKVARHKLDSMLGLGESAACRRKYLLGYFGQSSGDHCANCDTCVDPPEKFDATIDAQKLLSTIYRTGQIFGAGYVIDVLRGSENAKVKERKHDALTVYGLGKNQPKEHWNSVLRQLLNLGFVGIKNWEYRSLALTEASREIMTGKLKLDLRKQHFEETSNKELAKSKRHARLKVAETQHGRDDLFAKLKDLRTRIAKEKSVPPYVVFSDRSLNDMCMLLPKDSSEFLNVNGVGQAKLDTYGSVFLDVIKDYTAKSVRE